MPANSSNPAVEFLEIAVALPQQKITIWAYCQKCMTRAKHILKSVRDDNGEIETYACEDCGSVKEYKVG